MKTELQHSHRGVVHQSPRRTRLRVPKGYRAKKTLAPVKNAIQQVPGVTNVEVNNETGSILVHHEDRPGILTAIGAAVEESAPELLAALLVPEGGEAATTFLSKMFKRYLLEPRPGQPAETGTNTAPDAGEPAIPLKKVIPAAFLAAGVWKLIETESLLGGVAPLVLFYYAFDTYWKFGMTDTSNRIEATGQVLESESIETRTK